MFFVSQLHVATGDSSTEFIQLYNLQHSRTGLSYYIYNMAPKCIDNELRHFVGGNVVVQQVNSTVVQSQQLALLKLLRLLLEKLEAKRKWKKFCQSK
jgi:hypothetical protein